MKNEWRWYGYPGHFIGAESCLFRMCTEVNGYLISTVGDYRSARGGERVEIGYGRTFETFVFKAGNRCDDKNCNCGMPKIDGNEIDSMAANSPGEAQANHMEMCLKYAAIKTKRAATGTGPAR